MNPFTLIRDYYRWCKLWRLDFQSDDWRDDADDAWEMFVRWCEGDFHENWKRAVVLAKREIALRDAEPMPEEWQKLFKSIEELAIATSDAIGAALADITPTLQAFANTLTGALGTLTLPQAASFTYTAQHAAEQDAALDALAWYHDLPKETVAAMVQKETASGLWSFEQAIERVRIKLAKGH